ncbi:hypothetical protein HYW74_00240 [Candidatus Pacearchaeota archaeon]|nr:hypothetical protein [Candidatus Pacearchaeota archaeon]
MEEKDLVSRINEVSVKFDYLMESFMVYAGIFDFGKGVIIPPDKIKEKNINLREATDKIFNAYPLAIELIILCNLALVKNENYSEYEKIYRERISLAERVVSDANKLISYAISRLPNQF